MGGSSSGGSTTPYEAPNTLSSAQSLRIIDAISEGVVSGFANGDTHPFKSVFLNDTAVQNPDGSFNFKGLLAYFTKGTPDQSYIPAFDASERTVPVSTQVKQSTPVVRAVTDNLISSLRITVGVDRNLEVRSNGDTVAANTSLIVQLINNDGVKAAQTVTFNEKGSGVYYQDIVFDTLPAVPFNIKVLRQTADSTTDKVSNNTYFASYVEIIDAKLSYPHTAIAALAIDSDQFGSSVPRRNYLLKGRLVKVPSNYNPNTRVYTGTWDGSFKTAWTNNPAWVFYDVLTQPRFSSLARRLKVADIDRWSLYQIARYCDELVDDGFGGKEPRFVCNAYITDITQAHEFLTNLASVFTGLPIWNGSQVSVVIDANTDPVAQYNNTNVKDGLFGYSGVAYKSIHTAVHVKYVDKYDGYRSKTEYVANDEAIKRYGLNIKQVTAFGCDSRGQAARFGAWTLQTELRQQNMVSFEVGRDGLKHLPYDIVQVMDNQYAGAELSGRVVAVSGDVVTLDREVVDATGKTLNFVNVTDGVGRNLLKNSNVPYRSTAYSTRYQLTEAPAVGDDVVVTLWGELGVDRSGIGVFNTQGFSEITKLVKISDGVYQGKGKWRKPTSNGTILTPNDTHLNVYFYPNGAVSENVINQIKLERGTEGTDWCPAETENTTLGKLQTAVIAEQVSANQVRIETGKQISALDTWILVGKVKPRLYRAMGIKENTDDGTYTITALLHDPKKYNAVDTWANFDREITTLHSLTPQLINATLTTENGEVVLTWDNQSISGEALTYDIKVYRNNTLYRHEPAALKAEIRLENLPNGDYKAEIRGRNARGVLSEPLVKSWSVNYEVTGLRATPKVLSIALDWIVPAIAVGQLRSEVWVSKTNNLDTATKLVSLVHPQNTYTMTGVSVVDTYYFWVRIVDANGNAGEFTASVQGQADKDPAPIVEMIQGQITKSSLAKTLVDELNNTTDTKVALAVAAEATARAKGLADEAANRTNAIKVASDKAAVDLTAKATELGVKITAVENVNTTQAQQISTVTAAQGQTAAGLEQEKTARINGDTAEATARATLAARVTTAEANITKEETARITADNAQVVETNALKARVGITESDIVSVREVINTKDKATATEINKLSAKVDSLSSGGRNLLKNSNVVYRGTDYRLRYQLTEAPAVGDDIVVTLWGELGADRSGIGVYNTQGFTEITKLTKTGDGVYQGKGKWVKPTSNGTTLTPNDTHLNVYFYPNGAVSENVINQIKLERGNVATDWTPAPEEADAKVVAVQASLDSYKSTQATMDAAQTNSINSAVSRIGNAESKISTIEQTIATNQQAMASRVSVVEASTNSNTASISQTSTAVSSLDGKVSAMHVLKTETLSNGRKVVAGVALGADGQTGDSQMLVYANKFGIVDPTSKAMRVPFAVVTENGQTRVALDGDMIASGTIHGGHIVAGTDISAPVIHGGTINAAQLNAVGINSGYINLGNGNCIIDTNGNLYANNGTFNGTVRAEKIEGVLSDIVFSSESGFDVVVNRRLRSLVRRTYYWVKQDVRAGIGFIQPIAFSVGAKSETELVPRFVVNGQLQRPTPYSALGEYANSYKTIVVADYSSMGVNLQNGLIRVPSFRLPYGSYTVYLEVYCCLVGAAEGSGDWGNSDTQVPMQIMYTN